MSDREKEKSVFCASLAEGDGSMATSADPSAIARHTGTVKYSRARYGTKRGEFYVSREGGYFGTEYLHDDGRWRSQATRMEKGKEVMGGWFDTRELAEAALAKAEGRHS